MLGYCVGVRFWILYRDSVLCLSYHIFFCTEYMERIEGFIVMTKSAMRDNAMTTRFYRDDEGIS